MARRLKNNLSKRRTRKNTLKRKGRKKYTRGGAFGLTRTKFYQQAQEQITDLNNQIRGLRLSNELVEEEVNGARDQVQQTQGKLEQVKLILENIRLLVQDGRPITSRDLKKSILEHLKSIPN